MSISPVQPHSSGPTLPDLPVLIEYLSHTGWTLLDSETRSSVWSYAVTKSASPLYVALPSSQDFADYESQVYEALRTVSWVERRRIDEIVSDIVLGPADGVAVRVHPDMPSGEAPLGLVKIAVTALRDFVVASASAQLLNEPTLVLPTRRPLRAESYADRVRVSTQPGSFVFSLALPIAEENDFSMDTAVREDALIPEPSNPFGRQVRTRMASTVQRAILVAQQVSDGERRIESFGQADPGAPNATELAALGALGGPDFRPYEILFNASPQWPIENSRDIFRVTPGQQRVLVEAAQYLRERKVRYVSIQGLVIRLERVGAVGPGDVVIQGPDDDTGKLRRYRVNLAQDEYDEAIRLHRQGLRVAVSGQLRFRGNRRWVASPKGFAVVPGFDDDEM